MKTNDVAIWGIRINKSSKRASYEIRWRTASKRHSATRRTKALAEAFQSDLRQAAKKGEEFDVDSGLPDSMVAKEAVPEPEPARSFLALAQEYVTRRWPHAAPKTRDGMTDALATVIPVLIKDQPGAPERETLRTALRQYILLPVDKRPEPSAQTTRVVQWLETASVAVTDLAEAKLVRCALDALTVNLDGTKAGANTINRKRAVFHNVLEYAVELGRVFSRGV